MKLMTQILAIFATLSFFAPAVQAQDPLESLLEVYMVEQVATDNGVDETLVEVDEAEPGSILEYVLTYTNTSDQGLKGFVIKNPVPANTSYSADSATLPAGASFMVSIDHGATFETEPVVRVVQDENGDDKEIIIPPDQYNALQWIVDETLESGATMSMHYRVTID